MNKTYSVKASEIQRDWHLVDATDQVLGKLATRVAQLLMGKHKPMFSKHMDTGDNVVVINAAKVKVTGNKMKNKFYYRHSGYPGGLKSITLEKLMETYPERVIEYAVKGMVPRNKLGAQMMKKLRIYAGAEHPHQSQVNQAAAEAGQEK
jgi:large subunit ribosomal protein L13